MKYLQNLTETHFSADDNRIFVKRGEYQPITNEEAEQADVVFAIRRGWVKVLDKEPIDYEKPELPEIKFTDPFEAATIDPSELPGNKAKAEAEAKKTSTKATKAKE